MKLGLVVTDDAHLESARQLLEEASTRGWELRCFLTDRGVLLLNEARFTESTAFNTCSIAVCELSIERYENQGLSARGLDERIIVGGQYQDAELVRNCDRVVVL